MAPSTADVPPDSGDVTLPASANGHRVFLDGHVIGEGAKTFRVPCGNHTLKIGSAGTTHDLAVPCGGSVTVR
jgi:hypothetical protein